MNDVAVGAEVPGRWPAGSPTKSACPWRACAMLGVSSWVLDCSARRGCRISVLCSGMRVRVVLAKEEAIQKGFLPTYERNSSSICCRFHRLAVDADLQKTHSASKSCQNGLRMSREKDQLGSQDSYIPQQLPFEFQLYLTIELQHWCRCCWGSEPWWDGQSLAMGTARVAVVQRQMRGGIWDWTRFASDEVRHWLAIASVQLVDHVHSAE